MGALAVTLPVVFSLQRPILKAGQAVGSGIEEFTEDPLGYLIQIPIRAGLSFDAAMKKQEKEAQAAADKQQIQDTSISQPALNGIVPSSQDALESETVAIDCRARATERLRPDASKLEYLRSHALGEYCFEGDTEIQNALLENCNRWFKCKGTTAYDDIFPGYGKL